MAQVNICDYGQPLNTMMRTNKYYSSTATRAGGSPQYAAYLFPENFLEPKGNIQNPGSWSSCDYGGWGCCYFRANGEGKSGAYINNWNWADTYSNGLNAHIWGISGSWEAACAKYQAVFNGTVGGGGVGTGDGCSVMAHDGEGTIMCNKGWSEDSMLCQQCHCKREGGIAPGIWLVAGPGGAILSLKLNHTYREVAKYS